MKILKISMLTLLVTLCAAVAVITIIHLSSGGGNSDAQISDYSSDSDAPVGSDYAELYGLTEEERMLWLRALERPSGSEYWHYYPTIPDDAAPGTTVVLSASSHAFVEWETDEDYADVELFDQSSDGNFVYTSFIMPDEKVVIRALYDDGLLFGNAPLEQGDLVPTAETAYVELKNNLRLPDAMVGVKYDVIIIPEEALDDDTVWSWFSLKDLPPDFKFDHVTNNRATIYSITLPDTVGKYDFEIRLTYPNPDPEAENPLIVERYNCSLSVLPAPEISGKTMPEGMVGVLYTDMIGGISIPDEPFDPYDPTDAGYRVWELALSGTYPEGMTLEFDPDGTKAFIEINTPVEAGDYYFTIMVYTRDPNFDNTFIGSASASYTMKIWPRPVITPRTTHFLEGIVGVEYKHDNEIKAVHSPDPGAPVDNWAWDKIVSGLPKGFFIDDISTSTAKLTGIMDAEDEDYLTEATVFEFRAVLRSTDGENPCIGRAEIISEPFYIKIWPLPKFETGEKALPKGMDATPDGLFDEPDEPFDWYNTTIYATRFPDPDPLTSDTKWAWDYVGVRPNGLDFIYLPDFRDQAHIVGRPWEFGEFPFTIKITSTDTDNPNLHGATISQPFDLKIWERRYLYSNIRGDMKSYVSRDGEVWDEGDEEELRLRTGRRAVMPGNKGMISVFSNGGFVRWEAVPVNESSKVVKIGGPSEPGEPGEPGIEIYGLREPPFQLHNYVLITMPTAPDGDVYIHGALDPRPVIDVSLGVGTVDRPYSGYFMVNRNSIITGSTAVGPNVTGITWSVRGDWPPDLVFGQISGIISGTPTMASAGTYNFTVCLTLPGTMILVKENLSITINPAPDDRGDVNNDGTVNLADLILLGKYLNGGDVVINMENADINKDGRVDNGDLIILARFFTRPGPLVPAPSP